MRHKPTGSSAALLSLPLALLQRTHFTVCRHSNCATMQHNVLPSRLPSFAALASEEYSENATAELACPAAAAPLDGESACAHCVTKRYEDRRSHCARICVRTMLFSRNRASGFYGSECATEQRQERAEVPRMRRRMVSHSGQVYQLSAQVSPSKPRRSYMSRLLQ